MKVNMHFRVSVNGESVIIQSGHGEIGNIEKLALSAERMMNFRINLKVIVYRNLNKSLIMLAVTLTSQ